VTQVKTREKEGYGAVQIGVGTKRNISKTLRGHVSKFIDSGRKPFHRLREIHVDDPSKFQIGHSITVSTFQSGDVVQVTGTSKGRGFQGVVKRHGFRGQPTTHGTKDAVRMPGTIGAGEPQHVFKGTRMGGRMGGDRVTVKNLEIVAVDAEKNLLYVKGALPGSRNSLVVIMGGGDVQIGENILANVAGTKADAKPEQQAAVQEKPAVVPEK
jgi:large subunit ribosomal protein L3